MKSLFLYYLTGALSTSFANAGPIDCKRHVSDSSDSSVSIDVSVSLNPNTPSTPSTTTAASSATSTAAIAATTLTPLPPFGYLPIFYDDFSGIPGTLPSTFNWLFDTGTSYPGGAVQWGNNEKEVYTTSTSNIHITTSQTLIIIPLKDSAGNWTSARIETRRSDFACPKNRKLFIQTKMKLGDDPAINQQGIWPAFWALGSTFRGNYTNWPMATEWDIMETTNGLSNILTTIHCGTAPGGPCNEYNGIGNPDHHPMARGVWNTIGFEVDRTPDSWTEETLSWYLNGEKIFSVNGTTVGDEAVWAKLAHDEHFLLFNVAVGGTVADVFSLNGTQGNTPNKDTVGGVGSAMEVDYVGVWVSPLGW